DGRPGAAYWVNRADYALTARLDPARKRLDGTARIRYTNHSPDALRTVVLELTQNFHRPDAVRAERAEATGGVTLDRVAVRGQALTEGTGYRVTGTVMSVTLPQPLGTGQSVELEVAWHFTLPQSGAGARMGYLPAEGDLAAASPALLFHAYWYPMVAVYDDVRGWNTDPFLGPGEFYSDHGDYELTVEVPAGWVVQATGALQNPEEVFTAETRRRLARADASDTPVRVAEATETPTVPGALRYRFRAERVRDAAFFATKGYVWDAARTSVGDRDGDGREDFARAQALWRTSAPRWAKAAGYAQHSVRFLSRFSGLPYPWPHMTAVEGGGLMGGGMEYPMLTLIGDYNRARDADLYAVVVHEIAHMWDPMIVSTDERRYGWLDEGHTMYHENQAEADFAPGQGDYDHEDQRAYVSTALSGEEGEMLRRSNYHYPGRAATTAAYDKPSALLVALRELIGRDVFNRAWQTYHRDWAYKHPYPYDFWNTVERVAGRDLDWFWNAWYGTTWQLDHALASVTPGANGTEIVVRDVGRVPMPVRLRITYAGGRTEAREIPVERWLGGATEARITVPGRAERVEIDPERWFPEVERSNNVWPRSP
ncbi:MAG TPA: M1 family metallopeptidase, partial [Rhodothermales bacterium]|nr:M1 family metallopeptidase [Rhodothermales bacterium]